MSCILDASALLAFLHDEPGAERVRAVLDGALVSSVNWAEVVQKALARNVAVTGMREEFADVGVVFESFTAAQGELAAALWLKTRSTRLSLADRACLALAMHRQLPVLTADREWLDLALEVEVDLIR